MTKIEVENALKGYLQELGVTDPEMLNNTPDRWLRFLKDYSVGMREPYKDFKVFPVEEYKLNQMIVVDTKFSSLCGHHLLPFSGRVVLGYLPHSEVVGLSKIVKLITHLSKTFTKQEDLAQHICATFEEHVDSRGTAVTIRALHQCVACRYKEGRMLNTTLTKRFRPDDPKYNPQTHAEYMSYVNMIFNKGD